EPGAGSVTPPPPPPPVTATPVPGTATPTPATGPTTSIQVDDDLIDPGQQVRVTVIGRGPNPIAWIMYTVVLGDDNPDTDHSPATDPELATHDFSCESQTECANIWTIAPTTPGRYTLWARAADTSGQRGPWASVRLRIRDVGTATTVPTSTP